MSEFCSVSVQNNKAINGFMIGNRCAITKFSKNRILSTRNEDPISPAIKGCLPHLGGGVQRGISEFLSQVK